LIFESCFWQAAGVGSFRYAQFCPLACAAEILGERWTLLILRELFVGPQRFSDLRRRLPGVSSSILAARLARLEERGLVARSSSAPPTPAALYELAPPGRDLEPALVALARWGARFLSTRQPEDHVEPDWVRLGLHWFARSGPTPQRAYAIRIPDPAGEVEFRVEGGPAGTAVTDRGDPGDVLIRAQPLQILGLAAGALDPAAALRAGAIHAEGDLAALADFSAQFQMVPTAAGAGSGGAVTPNDKGA
jgi:DNA-binding HxlR family transcriptional regulator